MGVCAQRFPALHPTFACPAHTHPTPYLPTVPVDHRLVNMDRNHHYADSSANGTPTQRRATFIGSSTARAPTPGTPRCSVKVPSAVHDLPPLPHFSLAPPTEPSASLLNAFRAQDDNRRYPVGHEEMHLRKQLLYSHVLPGISPSRPLFTSGGHHAPGNSNYPPFSALIWAAEQAASKYKQ